MATTTVERSTHANAEQKGLIILDEAMTRLSPEKRFRTTAFGRFDIAGGAAVFAPAIIPFLRLRFAG